ncbi:MAG: type II toxin-antitoxin system YhaV family toxin [Xenococcus sp. MO_188.B8]|nr:type II toxin-antitoxin system YhaV family toxin [Xenococcus sp. MO_188.B8]
MSRNQSLVINGWRIYAHPLFLNQFEELITTVENLRRKNPETYRSKNATKRLAAIAKLAFEIIPADPTRKEYRQGNTLGEDYKHWFRAKFFQQYRLFFRYHQGSKIIVYAWINDYKSKRAYGSKTDAYRVFQKMLNSGNPPDNWNSLLTEAKRERERLSKAIEAQKFN